MKNLIRKTTDRLRYVLDTNVCIQVLKGHRDAVNWYKKNRDQSAITDVIALELCRGVKGRKDRRLLFFKFIRDSLYLDTHREDVREAKKKLAHWNVQKSQKIPKLPDFMIGQVAIANGLILLTFDDDFEPMKPELSVETPHFLITARNRRARTSTSG